MGCSEDWEQLVAPLATAWAERHRERISGSTAICRRCQRQAWPKAYVRRAIGTLVDDLTAGRNIKNPGGLLAVSAREGRTALLPHRSPTDGGRPRTGTKPFPQ